MSRATTSKRSASTGKAIPSTRSSPLGRKTRSSAGRSKLFLRNSAASSKRLILPPFAKYSKPRITTRHRPKMPCARFSPIMKKFSILKGSLKGRWREHHRSKAHRRMTVQLPIILKSRRRSPTRRGRNNSTNNSKIGL